MTHGHGQQVGDWLWWGWGMGEQQGKTGTTVIEQQLKKEKKLK